VQRNPVQLVSKHRRKESVSMMNRCHQVEQERTKCSGFTYYYDEGEDVTELMMVQ
jgi:hypothetical protein